MKINWLKLLGAVGIVLLVVSNIKGCQDAKELKNLNEALGAEMETWKDKDGNHIAKIEALEARNSKTFTDLEVKDSLIRELQEEVKKASSKIKKGGSVTIVEGETKFDTIFIQKDTPVLTSLFKTPIKSGFSNEWISSEFGFKLDSIGLNQFKVGETMFNLKVKNKYVVTIGRDGKKPFAMVKNLNPYSETTAIRAFQTTGKERSKFTLGAFFGPGVLLASEPKAGLVAGAGINYKF